MAKVRIPPEKIAELKQKHNVTDEAIQDFADSLEVEVDEPATTTPQSSSPPPEEQSFGDLAKAYQSGEISFTQYLMWSEMQERKAENKRQAKMDQERLDLMRDERRSPTPAWAEPLISKVNSLEARVGATPPSRAEDPILKVYEERSKDLMTRLEKQDAKYDGVLQELKTDREKAKDDATKAMIDANMKEVQGKVDDIRDLMEELPKMPQDPLEFLSEAKRRAEALGIEVSFGGGGKDTARSREELQVKTADSVIGEIRGLSKEARDFMRQFGDSVILPRMKVETGVSKTGPMTTTERTKYYKDLGITQ